MRRALLVALVLAAPTLYQTFVPRVPDLPAPVEQFAPAP